MDTKNMPHVVIVGGGFGGLWATRALATSPVRITLIDRTNHHLFQPLLYQVATAGLSAPDIAAPLRHILRKQKNVTVLLGEVTAIDTKKNYIALEKNHIGYDFLIVAAGASHAYFGNSEWEKYAPGLKTLDDAFVIRERILNAFEAAEREDDPQRRAQWLNFVVIGAGPTGLELAGTLAEIARHTLPQEFRRCRPSDAHIHLLEAGPRVLAAMPESLSTSAQQQLEQLGVTVHIGKAVTHIDSDGVTFGETHIQSKTVLWAAGVAASSLGQHLGEPLDRAGRVKVQADLSLAAHPEVFVIGDLASVMQANGLPVPGTAPAAKQMGTHAAKMIRARLNHKANTPFSYRDYGNLATIGRKAAVVDLGKLKFSGFIAWCFWLSAHLFFLIGFRNRLIVLVNWAWSYVTYQRGARIIGKQKLS
jgi:NADH:ubiquinone reductase (H+-translocating)